MESRHTPPSGTFGTIEERGEWTRMELIAKLTALVFAIVFHEVAHGYVAYRLGDPTAKNAGRLTLNPLAHVDLMGSIILPLILVITKSPMLIGWAKPVPINPLYFRNPKTGTMLVGIAGPVTNIIMAVLVGTALRIFAPEGLIGLFLFYACFINVILAVFNLLPIPPLDGSRVVMGFMPSHLIPKYLVLERFGFVIVFILLNLGIFEYVIWPVAIVILKLILGATGSFTAAGA